MISRELEDQLRNYEIGKKIRALRLRKKMGLVELGKHTGLSPALLSKIERTKLFPPLPTLLRIAMVFGVGLEYFFADEDRRHPVVIVRRDERQRFPQRQGAGPVSYFFESLDFPATEKRLSSYYAEFVPLPRDEAQPHEHEGAELVFVLTGVLGLAVGKAEYELAEGDAIYFDSSVAHAYRQIGRKTCTAIVITAP